MDIVDLNQWVSEERQIKLIERLTSSQIIGMTRPRATYLVRLYVFVCIQEQLISYPDSHPPLEKLVPPSKFIRCSHDDAATIFYGDQDLGGDRAAGMMLKTLSELHFISRRFLGDVTEVKVNPCAELQECDDLPSVTLSVDDFNPRRDAMPIASLLAAHYNWMNRNTQSVPLRIAKLLRQWAKEYSKGMRVLRRDDNQKPVGFYLLYPITLESEENFSRSPAEGLHLGSLKDEDPFEMAPSGDEECQSIFVRSWVIQREYQAEYRVLLLKDILLTLASMQKDFPELVDLWTLIIHPSYGRLADAVGFQPFNRKTGNALYWVYQSLDDFLELDPNSIRLDEL